MKYLNGVAVCCLGSILFLSCQEQFEEDSERQEGQQLPMSVIAQIGVIHNEPIPRYSGEVGSAILQKVIKSVCSWMIIRSRNGLIP